MLVLEGCACITSTSESGDITIETATPEATRAGIEKSGYEVIYVSIDLKSRLVKLIARRGNQT